MSLEAVPDGGMAKALESVDGVLDHIAHAVPSVRSALPLYRDLLGGRIYSGGINSDGGHMVVQLIYPNGGKIELIQPASPDSKSVGRFLQRFPQGGLHHITFKVSDVAAAAATMAAAGYHPFGTRVETPWQETFLHPRETGGVLVQLARSTRPDPDGLSQPLEDLLEQAEALAG